MDASDSARLGSSDAVHKKNGEGAPIDFSNRLNSTERLSGASRRSRLSK
jgi:hypothetical protein